MQNWQSKSRRLIYKSVAMKTELKLSGSPTFFNVLETLENILVGQATKPQLQLQ